MIDFILPRIILLQCLRKYILTLQVNSDVAAIISSMVDTADVFLNDIADEQRTALEKKVLTNVISGDELSAKLLAFFVNCKPYAESENSSVLIYRKSIDSLPVQNSLVHVHILQVSAFC